MIVQYALTALVLLAAMYLARLWFRMEKAFNEPYEGEPYNVPHFHVDRHPVSDTNTYWKHRKSGGLYTVLYDLATREHDLVPVVVYRAVNDGRIWVRPQHEFYDGRFEMVELED